MIMPVSTPLCFQKIRAAVLVKLKTFGSLTGYLSRRFSLSWYLPGFIFLGPEAALAFACFLEADFPVFLAMPLLYIRAILGVRVHGAQTADAVGDRRVGT